MDHSIPQIVIQSKSDSFYMNQMKKSHGPDCEFADASIEQPTLSGFHKIGAGLMKSRVLAPTFKPY